MVNIIVKSMGVLQGSWELLSTDEFKEENMTLLCVDLTILLHSI